MSAQAALQIDWDEEAVEPLLDSGTLGTGRQLIIDLETSALNPVDGDIIRLRAVNRWDSGDEYDEWIKPPRPLTVEAERIIGTTNDRLSNCRPIDAALPDYL